MIIPIKRVRHTGTRDALSAGCRDLEKVAYRMNEAAELLGISRTKVYELVLSDQLRSIKIGRRRIIPRSALAEFLGDPSLLQGPPRGL